MAAARPSWSEAAFRAAWLRTAGYKTPTGSRLWKKISACYSRKTIREIMLHLAYHEAGHLAFWAFWHRDLSEVRYVTIYPNTKRASHLACPSPYLALPRHRGLAVASVAYLLAGSAAEARLWPEDDPWEFFDLDDEEWHESDVYRAHLVARMQARSYLPAARILRIAHGWAQEALKVPATWAAIEKIVGLLLKQGRIGCRQLVAIPELQVLEELCLVIWCRRFDRRD